MRVSRVIELMMSLPMDEDIAINWLERRDVEEHFECVLTDTNWNRVMEMWHNVQDAEIADEMTNQVSQMLAFN